jgi:3-oxoacyl-[acyl-carrier protein] reductase
MDSYTAGELPRIDFTRLAPAAGFRLAVTGGCGGIGRRLVAAAVDLGLEVIVIDLPQAIERFAPPPGVLAIGYDARKQDGARTAFAKVAARWNGALDGFVHLPGYMTRAVNLDELDPAEFDEGISVNLKSAFLATKEVLPLMRRAGAGSIVLVASGLATLVEKGTATYSAAKAGVIAMCKGLAKENAPRIRVNALAPAAVDTEFLRGGTGRGGEDGTAKSTLVKDMDLARILQTIPMGRIAVAEDVVGPALFLLGQASRFMTGQTLYINGGRLMI